MDQTLTPGIQAVKASATEAFLEDPGVTVGIVEEAVSRLVQRQEYGAQRKAPVVNDWRSSMIVWAAVLSRSPPASRPG